MNEKNDMVIKLKLSNKTARWIACDYEFCGKWRKMPDSLPQIDFEDFRLSAWYCYMNPDHLHNRCASEEEKWSDEITLQTQTEIGEDQDDQDDNNNNKRKNKNNNATIVPDKTQPIP